MDQVQVVEALEALDSEAAAWCLRSLRQGKVRYVEHRAGSSSAGRVVSRWRSRAASTLKSGIRSVGFQETLDALEQLPSDAQIHQASFQGEGETFVSFLLESGEIVGCIGVEHRDSLGTDGVEVSG